MRQNQSKDSDKFTLSRFIFKLTVMVVVLVVSLILNMMAPSPTYAKSIDTMNPTEKAKSWIYYNSLSECINNTDIIQGPFMSVPDRQISESRAMSGQWFENGVNNAGPWSINPTTGYFLKGVGAPTSIGKDGKIVGCGGTDIGWIKDALVSIWGYENGVDALCAFGAVRSNDSGNIPCNAGTGGYFTGPGINVGRLNLNTFRDKIKEKVYNNQEPPDLASDISKLDDSSKAAKYILYSKSFFVGCLGNISKQPASQQDIDKLSDSEKKDFLYTLSTGSYIGSIKKNDSIAFYISKDMKEGSDTCGNIESVINNTYSSYTSVVTNNDSDPNIVSEDVTNKTPYSSSKSSCNIDGVGWIVCPVVTFLGSMSTVVFNFLANNLLVTKTNLVSTDSATYSAWQVMRNFANVAFVIVFMVIIFSQITSYGIDNYGIKKMLPRLVIAAILVNVSFFICQIAVDLSNILGYSLNNLFSNTRQLINIPQDNGTTFTGIDITAITANALLGTGAVVVGGVALLLSITVPVLLAVLAAVLMTVLILIARTSLIVLLIVISPLAFVAYVLPKTTDKLFGKWYKMFQGLLLVFPIVSLLFGAGNLAAYIISVSNPHDEVMQLFALGIAVVPLFAVPMVLKGSLNSIDGIGKTLSGWSDRANGRIGGKVKETSRAGQIMKYRKSNTEKNRALINSGQYKGRNVFNRGMSSVNNKLNGFKYTPYGTEISAAGVSLANKQEDEAISNRVTLMKSGGSDKAFAEAQKTLLASMTNGDIIGARAAASILQVNNKGRDMMYDTIKTGEANRNSKSNAVLSAIKSDVTNKMDMKGKNIVLDTWGTTDETESLANLEVTKKESILMGLTAQELAGQSYDKVLSQGYSIPETVAKTVIGNPNISLDTNKIAFFDNIKNGNNPNVIASEVELKVDYSINQDNHKQ